MNTCLEFDQIIEARKTTTTIEALNLFDHLDIVDLDFMIGRWKGSSFSTKHKLDGSLEAFNWYGKEFIDANNVHPLLFSDMQGEIFKVDPGKIPLGKVIDFPIPENEFVKPLFLSLKWILATDESKARIRMMEHRGKVSATMIYDDLPINDIFRKVDENTLLGLMDLKGIKQPFFFVLKRS